MSEHFVAVLAAVPAREAAAFTVAGREVVLCGRVRALPAVRPLRTYDLRVDETGRIFITLED